MPRTRMTAAAACNSQEPLEVSSAALVRRLAPARPFSRERAKKRKEEDRMIFHRTDRDRPTGRLFLRLSGLTICLSVRACGQLSSRSFAFPSSSSDGGAVWQVACLSPVPPSGAALQSDATWGNKTEPLQAATSGRPRAPLYHYTFASYLAPFNVLILKWGING